MPTPHPFTTTTFSNLLEPSTHYDLNWEFPSDINNIPLTNHIKQVSAPSLFSTSHQNHEAAATMSATALLQKAAEIGAVATSEAAAVLGGSNDSNKLCGLYSTSTVTCSGFGSSDVESSVNEESAINNQMQIMYSSSKRRRMEEEIAEGETRDFLGVGISTPMCHPSSINGWI